MKLIHFAPYFPPERLGGVGEFVAGLHNELLARGHESVVVTTGRDSTDTVFRIARNPLLWFVKTALWADRAAEYDVVHCQSGEAIPLILMLALRRKNATVLATFHVNYGGIAKSFEPYSLNGRRFAEGLRPILYRTVITTIHRLIDWLTIRLAGEVNTISLAWGTEVSNIDSKAGRNVIYYGLPPLEEPVDTQGIKPVALFYAGAPGHRKRVNALPAILHWVRKEIPDATLRIAGFDLHHQPELKALFEEKGLLPYVECIGQKKSSELPPYYACADTVVVPSAYEGLPLVILEAMQCGTPVVATRVSGHPEAIVNGQNGFLVPPDNPEAMAARCVQIMLDPELKRRLGEAARTTIAEKFTLERQVDEYLQLYERIKRNASQTGTGDASEGSR